MKAIFGLYRMDGDQADATEALAMSRALAHRGGHASVVTPAPFLLFGRRCDAAAAQGVAADGRTGAFVLADARIDNRAELTTLLGATAGLSDAELILAAYLKWGAESPRQLVGDFSYVVWDPRVRTLFCARDPMGVRPLYYYSSRSLFAFATEIKGLHVLSEVPRALDDQQVALFLAGMEPDRDRTLFGDVRRLPAGHTLRVTEHQPPVLRRYWSAEEAPVTRYSSRGEYVEAFRSLFDEAVRCRLDENRPVATALSGGLDSSAITCVARGNLGAGSEGLLNGISLVFPELAPADLRLIDERPYAEKVVADGGLRWHQVRGDRVSPLGDMDRMIQAMDLPFAAPNLYLHWAMYGAARDAGTAVFLDGLDGDSVVSHGFGRLNGLLRAGAWDTFEHEVRSFARHRGIDPAAVLSHFGFPYLHELVRSGNWIGWGAAAWQLARRFGLSRGDLLLKHGLSAGMPAAARAQSGDGAATGAGGLLRSDLGSFVRKRERLLESAPALDEHTAHVAGISLPAYQTTLEMADACAAVFGVEPRYPFFDRRLIEFCLSVPEEMKFANGWGRLIFREAMEGVLPSEIQWRTTKSNLSPNFQRQFALRDRSLVDAIDFEEIGEYLDVRGLDRVRSEYFAQDRGWGDRDSFLILRAATLARWKATVGSSARPAVQAFAA